MEGRDWEKSVRFRREDLPIGQLIDQMYSARATNIYVDAVVGREPQVSGRLLIIDVDLPTTPEQREACFHALTEFQKANPACLVTPDLPTTSRYLEIKILD